MSTEFPTYQPSVYYFRRELREAKSRERAIVVALIAMDEWERLRNWAAEYRVIPAGDIAAGVEYLRQGLRQSVSLGQAILLGLFVCHELERLKAQVREAGLIPPKWIVLPEEAEEKGWEAAS